MQSCEQRLIEEYSRHYARLNGDLDKPAPAAARRQLERTYGWLIRDLPAGTRVLDLGCGAGWLLEWLSRFPHLISEGVDVSPSQVEAARRRIPEVAIHCADGLEFLQLRQEVYGAIFCLDVLEHLDEATCWRWLAAIRAALRSGGFLVCRTPNAANLLGAYSRYLDLTHRRSFTQTSLTQLLEAAGFVQIGLIRHRAGSILGAVRLAAENLLHRTIYLICAHRRERVFTNSISLVAYRP
ncbi:MAG: class I SAM-dependent methyltransferase [Bryobacterales bacterium]|nr:class I SAM-dependent methyltransferase [Bryobacteraceae bacterium]MDW8355588.1 class I SAM-dependent methyltransferase [Bryobacterales bacterium]